MKRKKKGRWRGKENKIEIHRYAQMLRPSVSNCKAKTMTSNDDAGCHRKNPVWSQLGCKSEPILRGKKSLLKSPLIRACEWG